jgi:hypothetical protein
MADLSQTRTNVAVAGPGSLQCEIVGEAVLQGQPGYRDVTTGKWMKAANTSQALAKVACIFITAAAGDGSYSAILQGNGKLVNLGATLVVGKTYVVSGSGLIVEKSELITGKWIAEIGYAVTADLLKTNFKVLNVQVP